MMKKYNLDSSVFSNFRSISKLLFWSKVLERIVFIQQQSFLNTHSILEKFQSGFKTLHSTETALLKAFNDILLATDVGDSVILLLLDLTATFDTVDHSILLSRLDLCRIKGSGLDWFRSYLSDRSFSVNIGEFTSPSAPLTRGVPQGSILGPLLFSIYMLPLGSIFRKFNISFHSYADDTQIYFHWKHNHQFSLQPLLDCLTEVKAWMASNFLNFNENKTEVILFGSSGNCSTSLADLGSLEQFVKSHVKNLGVIFDSGLNFEKH
uniref:Reverse transcriptase domain-containing protein n=1 Tax=Kryptolebias marmoratus TaxID=37003 RepID=A0A3Q3ALA8_KRYMA